MFVIIPEHEEVENYGFVEGKVHRSCVSEDNYSCENLSKFSQQDAHEYDVVSSKKTRTYSEGAEVFYDKPTNQNLALGDISKFRKYSEFEFC